MTPFSCEECRAQLAALTNDANPSARLRTAATATVSVDELSPEVAAHLQSCADCRREYSMLRGIVGELRALPSFAAPADLRARIRNQLANETAVKLASTTASKQTVLRTTPRRSLFQGFSIPRWATYSLSGALATAFLLFVARDINPNLAPGRESHDTSSSAQQAVPPQAAPMGQAPSATKNGVANNGASQKSSIPQKVAPGAQRSTSDAPSSTRSATTAPAGNAPADNAPETKPFSQATPNQTQSDDGNSSVFSASAPKMAAPEDLRAPRLLPAPPGNSTPATERDASPQRGESTAASTSPTSSASGRSKTNITSSTSAKRFARLELPPPSAAPSGPQKAQPTRTEDSSVRQRSLFNNAPSLPKSDTNGDGAPVADASSANTMRTPSGNASVSGALSSTQSSTRSDGEARPGQDANQSAGDASSEQPDEHVSRSRIAVKGGRSARGDSMESSTSAQAASSTREDTTTRSAAPASAPVARATTRANTSTHDSDLEATPNTASGQFSATADAAATPIQNPLLPVLPEATRKNRVTKPAVPAQSTNGLNKREFANETRQSARLIVMPRHNAKRARILVTWISDQARAKEIFLVVWQGAARRNQEIAIFLSTPHGNKNPRAQVSLQSANARGEWQTLDTSVLSATPVAR